MPPDRVLTVTPTAAGVRRSLSPTVWLVLEQLALTSDHDGTAITNARRLAAELGMSKDTAARALRVLTGQGLVERIDGRDRTNGQFGSIAYRVDLVAAGLETSSPASASSTDEQPPERRDSESPGRRTHRAHGRTSRRSDASKTGDQLDLFEA
jgi:DNA-binding transcriptional MocR family regulator